jgi:A/G-specific adenine glycosylase
MLSSFTRYLLEWYDPQARPLPWKGIRDPYHIWLSEIILQQTRVEQGLPYFERFVATYSTIIDLANAPDDEVMKLWEGLGYYSRARNLLAAARQVAQEHAGLFPQTHAEILALKGVGPYTAAAIASFAFGLPHAVVDGNVFRVLARFFGIDTPQDSTEGKKRFAELAAELLDHQNPGLYNQAIMDFGATLCTPRNPGCKNCPMATECKAYQQDRVDSLPVKAKKIVRSERFFHYFLIKNSDQVFIQKRGPGDIWQELYEFPLLETEDLADPVKIEAQLVTWGLGGAQRSSQLTQELTHQRIQVQFWEVKMDQIPATKPNQWLLIPQANLEKYAFPRVIQRYLQAGERQLSLF